MSDYWAAVIEQIWGNPVHLERLDGELDLNFKAVRSDKTEFLVKVMRVGCDAGLVDMQCRALTHIKSFDQENCVPGIVNTGSGKEYETVADEQDGERIVWAIEFLPGSCYADFYPKSPALVQDIGGQLAKLDLALADFSHPSLTRELPWNLMQAEWIKDQLNVIEDADRRALIEHICYEFDAIKLQLHELPIAAIHNDINDYNILVSGALDGSVSVTGLIDLGDLCACPRICELAIAGAYLVLDQPDPIMMLTNLLAAYHKESPLEERELELLYPLLRMRLAVSLVTSTREAKCKPDDPYVVISQQPAWRFLEQHELDAERLLSHLRFACGFSATPNAPTIKQFLEQQCGEFAPLLGREMQELERLDLSVANSLLPQNPLAMSVDEAASMGCTAADGWSLGYYAEPRLIYTSEDFRRNSWQGSDRRTMHMGIDICAPAGTGVYAPLDAQVHIAEVRPENLDYGGLVILAHNTPDGDRFYTLYGHLDPESIKSLQAGQNIAAGQVFAKLGRAEHNGGWLPHLHFQLYLTDGGFDGQWSAIAYPEDVDLWRELSPNPANLLNLSDEALEADAISEFGVLSQRKSSFAGNLKLSYRDPVMPVRGWKHYLFDQWGRVYLDAYNNVPHVGHAHPRIQQIVSDQLRRINTNTRYLHPVQTGFADMLKAKLPTELSVCFFVNSGSEANELALRLARQHTGAKDLITQDHGYHGNTTGAVDISAYKFNAPGGAGQPDWVQLIDAPDVFRGKHRRDDTESAQKYAAQVDSAIERIQQRGEKLCGFITETYPSVGGQIIPPPDYLQHVFKRIRAAGGVCILDEVQTGLGRLGEYYFAFEEQQVVPDIVVLGKPIGNGHPLGVVITTQEIADSFAAGPEFFSTFGGSTLSCVIGKEVLDIVEDEQLQANAKLMGNRLLSGLRQLQQQHPVIGDVRGLGLFIGVELVANKDTLEPSGELASYIVNRFREHRILIGTEGPANNVLKIRPPLTIGAPDIDHLLKVFAEILNESAVRQTVGN